MTQPSPSPLPPRFTLVSPTLLRINVLSPSRTEIAIGIILNILAANCVFMYFPLKTQMDWLQAASFISIFLYLAYSLLDDTYIVEIDKGAKNQFRVIKKRLGRLQSVRVAPANQLAYSEVVSEPYTKTKQGYRLDFEFTSGGGSDNIGGGIYRIPSCDAVFLGDKNRELFETWEAWIRDWMALPLPPALLEKKVNARHAQRNRETSEGVETTTATTKVNKKKV